PPLGGSCIGLTIDAPLGTDRTSTSVMHRAEPTRALTVRTYGPDRRPSVTSVSSRSMQGAVCGELQLTWYSPILRGPRRRVNVAAAHPPPAVTSEIVFAVVPAPPCSRDVQLALVAIVESDRTSRPPSIMNTTRARLVSWSAPIAIGACVGP